MNEFTEERIADLIKNHGWELLYYPSGLYFLRQKDKHYLKTVSFELSDDVASRYLSELNGAYYVLAGDYSQAVFYAKERGGVQR